MVSTGYSHAETMQKLERLTQLETFVAGQRIRIEKYKAMYETLKTEHLQSEEAKAKKEDEIQGLTQQLHSYAEKYQTALNKAAVDYDAKSKECEQLRVQILTPQKMEIFKMKIQEEAEHRFKQKIETAELELNKFRSEFNKLRYDYSFLKSEFEHEQLRGKTTLKEQDLQHRLKVDSVIKERDALFEELSEQKLSIDSQKLRCLVKENTQLMQKVKSLHEELDDLQQEKATTGSQSDQVGRIQAKQLSEMSRKCKTLEAEKEMTRLQVERLQIEMEKSVKLQDALTNDLHNCQNQCKVLQSQMEENIHNSKLELNNFQISLTSNHGDLTRERDQLRNETRTYQQKMGVLEESMNHLKAIISKKEEEASARVHVAREEEHSKLAEFEDTNARLEESLAECERKLADAHSSSRTKLQHLEEALRLTNESKAALEKELQSFRSQLQASKLKMANSEKDKTEMELLKNSSKQIKNEFERLQVTHQHTHNEKEGLQNKVDLLTSELKMAQTDLQEIKSNMQGDVANARKKADAKNITLQQERDSFKKDLDALNTKHQKFIKAAKKRHKQQKQDISDLQDRLDILKLKEDHAQKEKSVMVNNLNLEHGRTKRRLEKLRQRQNQFNQVLNATSVGVPEITPIVNLSNVSGILLQPKDDSADARFLSEEFHSTPIPDELADELSN